MEVGIKKFTFEELEVEEKNFQRLSEEEKSDLLVQLYDSFSDLTPEQDYAGRFSYFRWYTYLVWSDLLMFNKESFVPLVIRRQIFEAFLAGFDVWEKIILYFDAKCFESEDYRALFIQVKDAFVNSDAVVGEWQGQPYRVADAVKEKTLLRSMGNDSIRAAELLNKFKKIIALDNDKFAERFVTATADEILNDFNDLIDFFLDTEPNEAEMVVEMYVNPEAYGLTRTSKSEAEANYPAGPAPRRPVATPALAPLSPPARLSASGGRGDGSERAGGGGSAAVSAKAKPAVTLPAPLPTAKPVVEKPSYADIRAKIDSAFKKDAAGNYSDLDGVMDALQKAAEKYNDPKIAELLYWDEGESRFKWNV
ncbi:MAG: hypothetical protein PHD72_04210 [Patescibacteria group bacterium]|nr:hypothetical protein [Patescibacteria group bacterium]